MENRASRKTSSLRRSKLVKKTTCAQRAFSSTSDLTAGVKSSSSLGRLPGDLTSSSASLKSTWSSQPRVNDFVEQKAILHGNLKVISEPRLSCVQTYLCCNKDDSYLERVALRKSIVCKLQKECESKWDVEFKLIDPNGWNRNVSILERKLEIKRCNEKSLSVGFVAFIGQKYSSAYVPPKIDSRLFEVFLKVAYDLKPPNYSLIDRCYERDENAVPAEYILKTEVLAVENDKNLLESRSLKLQSVLQLVATKALEQKLTTEQEVEEFMLSCLDVELECGLFGREVSDPERFLCYIRNISEMETDMNITRVTKYVDVLVKNTNNLSKYVSGDLIDSSAQSKIYDIRKVRLPLLVSESDGEFQVYTCSVKWLPQVGIKPDTHRSYLDDFCNQFLTHVDKLTQDNIEHARRRSQLSEVLCHCLIAKKNCEKYQDSDLHSSVTERISDYIYDSSNNAPLLLFGDSGTGKSNLISKVALNIREYFPPSCDVICIVRFIGSTLSSSSLPLLLDSICSQLEKCLKVDKSQVAVWCTETSFLVERFLNLLSFAKPGQPIVVLVDGIDCLKESSSFKTLDDCFPNDLPPNVKIILTIDENHQMTQKLLLEKRQNAIHLDKLSQKRFVALVQNLLSNKCRKITTGQYTIAMQALQTNNKGLQFSPSQATLVYAQAKQWKSFSGVTSEDIGQGELEVTQRLILSIEIKYGRSLVRSVVKFLSCVKFGITEQDLRTLVAINERVKSEITERCKSYQNDALDDSEYISQCILEDSVSMILKDLAEILCVKTIGGCEVFSWVKNVKRIFTTDKLHSAKTTLFDFYADYLEGQVKVERKVPLKAIHICMEVFAMFESEENENRDEMLIICPFNFCWLNTILTSFGAIQLLILLKQIYNCHKKQSVLVLERAVRLSLPVISKSKLTFAGELFSRLYHLSSTFPLINELLIQCTFQKSSKPILLPAGVHASAPGAPLRVSIVESQSVTKGLRAYAKESSLSLVYAAGKSLKIYDILNGDLVREILFKDSVEWIKTSLDVKYIIVCTTPNSSLFILEESTGTSHPKISLKNYFHKGFHEKPMAALDAFASKNFLSVFQPGHSNVVIVVDLPERQIYLVLSCLEKVLCCHISTNEKHIFVLTVSQSVWVYDITTGDNISCLYTNTPDDPINYLFESHQQSFIAVHLTGFVNIWNFSSLTGQFTLTHEIDSRSSRLASNRVQQAALSSGRDLLVVTKGAEVDVWSLDDWQARVEVVARLGERFSQANLTNCNKYLLITLEGTDCAIYVWSVESATCISILDGHLSDVSVISVPQAPEGDNNNLIAVSFANLDSIKVWNLENISFIPSVTSTGRSVSSVFCAEHTTITTDHSPDVVVWETINGDIRFTLRHLAEVSHCCHATFASKIVTADVEGNQYVWDLKTGSNLVRIKGPKVDSILISPNEQIVISIFAQDASDQPINASRVWRLESSQVVCTFNHPLLNAQATSKNTFLVGLSPEGALNAVSLWMGMLAKVISPPDTAFVFSQALKKRDEVMTLDTNNYVTVWSIPEGISLLTIDMKGNLMRDIRVSDSGAIMTFMDPRRGLKALDVRSGRLRDLQNLHLPLTYRITGDGRLMYYLSMNTSQVGSGGDLEAEYDLVLVKLANGRILGTYPLESVPTCVCVFRGGRKVAVGTDEGRVVVFNVTNQDSKSVFLQPARPKNCYRTIYYSKQRCDAFWHEYEPKYELLPSTVAPESRSHSSHHKSSSSSFLQGANSADQKKMSIRIQRNSNPAGKSVNLSRISNSSKVRVFM